MEDIVLSINEFCQRLNEQARAAELAETGSGFYVLAPYLFGAVIGLGIITALVCFAEGYSPWWATWPVVAYAAGLLVLLGAHMTMYATLEPHERL